jgi:hypothetical protein
MCIAALLLLTSASACRPVRGRAADPSTTSEAGAAIACPSDTVFVGEGPPRGRAAWCVDADGRQHGPAMEWFDDGTVRSEGAYAKGAMTGAWRSFYSGGVVRSEKTYRDGVPTGTWTTFFADGSPSTVHVYASADRVRVTEFGPGKKKLREGELVGGARHGTWIEWDAYGNELRSEWDGGKPKSGAVASGQIGIAECDEYLTKYSRCVDEKFPEAARGAAREAMAATAKAWREAAAGPAKDGLAQGCKAALDAGRQATEGMGCAW